MAGVAYTKLVGFVFHRLIRPMPMTDPGRASRNSASNSFAHQTGSVRRSDR